MIARLGRPGAAGVVAAVAALLLVSGYHPCDGLGPLMIVPLVSGAIALVATLPNVSPRALLWPGAAVAVVLAFAIGLDYSSSGQVNPDGNSCEPVPGFAGFLLAAIITGVLAAAGIGVAMLIAWPVGGRLRLQADRGLHGESGKR